MLKKDFLQFCRPRRWHAVRPPSPDLRVPRAQGSPRHWFRPDHLHWPRQRRPLDIGSTIRLPTQQARLRMAGQGLVKLVDRRRPHPPQAHAGDFRPALRIRIRGPRYFNARSHQMALEYLQWLNPDWVIYFNVTFQDPIVYI